MLASLWIVLFEFDLAGNKLFVLARVVHLSGAFVLELYQLIL